MSHQHRPIASKPTGKDLIFASKRRLGGLPVNPGGHWSSFLPEDDLQSRYVETEACASFGTLHAVETLMKQEFGVAPKLSGRFLAKISNTTQTGNDPHLVAEALRTKGCVNDADYPYTPDLNTWEKFYAELPPNLVALARIFIASYEFGHEYIVNPTPEKMLAALEFSPLGVGVWAWNGKDGTGNYLRPQGSGDDHWCVIYDYELGKSWSVFDSYDATHKKIAWDFGFDMVKKYTLHKNIIDERWQAWFVGFFKKLRLSLGFFTNAVGFKLGLGDAAPQNLDWTNPISARHSARVIMDNFGLTWAEKDLVCAVIMGESGFYNYKNGKPVSNQNLRKDGTLSSTDWGICQINDRYHVGKGNDFITIDYVLAHPEIAVTWMVKMYRLGHLNWWCAFANGSYRKYLPK